MREVLFLESAFARDSVCGKRIASKMLDIEALEERAQPALL